MRATSIKTLVIAVSLIFPVYSIAQDAAINYLNIGLGKQLNGDLDGAIADYDSAIELHPKFTTAYVNRGVAKQSKGDLDEALADFNRALEINPKSASANHCRGLIKYMRQNWTEALQDLRRSYELSEEDQEYKHIQIWLIRTRQGDTDAANTELASFFDKQKNEGQGAWLTKIVGYLLGNVSESALLAAAKSTNASTERGRLCEIWYYAGIKKLMAGSKAGGAVYFRKCLATNKKTFLEYQFAEAELKALGG